MDINSPANTLLVTLLASDRFTSEVTRQETTLIDHLQDELCLLPNGLGHPEYFPDFFLPPRSCLVYIPVLQYHFA